MVLKVDLAGQEYEMNVFSALGFKTADVVSKAYNPGHGLWIARGFDWLVMKIKGEQSYDLYPYVKDENAIDKASTDSGILEYNKTVEPRWKVTEDSLIIRKGKKMRPSMSPC